MIFLLYQHTKFPSLQDQLNDVVHGYRDYLEQQGHAPSRNCALQGTARHVVPWALANGTEVTTVGTCSISDFASDDHACPGAFRDRVLVWRRRRLLCAISSLQTVEAFFSSSPSNSRAVPNRPSARQCSSVKEYVHSEKKSPRSGLSAVPGEPVRGTGPGVRIVCSA